LAETIAVSFEENNIKLLHASLRGKSVVIDRAEIIPEEEFDDYLRREKATKFIVTYEFKESHHGILTIPVVKPRYLKKIIESEIRKTAEIKDFSFIYTPIGERIIENRKVLKIFYFAVRNEEIRNIVERFYDNGKIVSAIYPTAFSVAPLFDPKVSEGEVVIGVLGMGRERIAFLTKKGAIYFIRNFESLDAELSDFDIQNISMTINYCFQNIKITPSLILLAGTLSKPYNITAAPPTPLACLHKAEYIHCSKEIFDDFLIPIASLYAPKSSNILSKEFKNLYTLRDYMVKASKIFVILTILCLGFIFLEVKNIIDKKDLLRLAIRNKLDIEDIFSEYIAKEAEMKQYIPVVDFLNSSSPEVQKLLIALAEIDMKNIKFNFIEARAKGDDSFLVTIEGISNADTYTSMQGSFKNVIDALGKMEDIEITNRTMDFGSKTFRIEMSYKKLR
jgi:hypothetical protein